MRKRNNPIPKGHQRPRQIHMGFADDEFEEQEALPILHNWDRNCNGETYENLDLRHIQFYNSSLRSSSFINCDMRGCEFLGSNLTSTSFKGSDLRGASFETGFYSNIYKNINFESCDLSGASFGDAGDFASCTWNNANIEGANFRNRGFFLFFLDYKKTQNTSFYIHGTPTFKHISLAHNNLQDANLENINLFKANLRGANLQGANLQGANLKSTDLEAADMRDANLKNSNLQDANLRGAKLDGAKLDGAKYDIFTLGHLIATLGHPFLTDLQRSVMEYVDANEN